MKNKIEASAIAQKLRQQINYYSQRYYQDQVSEISDQEFDALLTSLKEIEKQYPELVTSDSPTQKVGGISDNRFVKVKHLIPMMSLDNAYDFDDLEKFNEQVTESVGVENVEYVLEPKIDGLSISLLYEDKKFIRAVTRGDGKIGEDVTHNLIASRDFPKNISEAKKVEIRGEVFMTYSSFNEMNKALESQGLDRQANPRNAAAGAVRQLEPIDLSLKPISIFTYFSPQLMNDLNSQTDLLNFLKKEGFQTTSGIKTFKTMKEIINYLKNFSRDSYDFPIDGMVVKFNNFKLYEDIGYTSKFPKWAIAYKFPPDIKQTYLREIVVTVGRTGRINYAAVVDPVEIAGTVVRNATLHNASYIQGLDLRIGDLVNIYKAGEIIPKVMGVVEGSRKQPLTEWQPITNCPSCNSQLVTAEEKIDQKCLNDNCNEQKIQKLIYFASRGAMNIDGLGEKQIRVFYNLGLLDDLSSIYSLKDKQEKLLKLERQGEKSITNLLASIEKTKFSSLDKFITSLGIEEIGIKAASLLVNKFKNLSEIMNASHEKISEISDFGPSMTKKVVEYFSSPVNREVIYKTLSLGVEPYVKQVESVESIFTNKKVVVTGSFKFKPRKEIEQILTEVHLSSVGSKVTSKTDFVLVGEEPGSKYTDALNLNKRIIIEEELKELL